MVSEDSDLPSEEMEDSRSEDRVLPWGTCEYTPSRVVTRRAGTSARDTLRSENLLLHTNREDTADVSSVDSSSRGNSETLRKGRSEPVVDES